MSKETVVLHRWGVETNVWFFYDQSLSILEFLETVSSFLTSECAHAHERVIAIVDFSLGRLVGWFGC